MFKLVLAYAVGRGVWNGLRGRTRVLRSYAGRRMRRSVFAYGDGIHDDSRNIQRIVDSQSGSVKTLPRGVFAVRESIHIGGTTEIRGAGISETVLITEEAA